MIAYPRNAVVIVGGAAAFAISAGTISAQEPQIAWEATGFEAPESAVYDPSEQVIYVSNVVGQPNEKDGEGYISKLGLDGQMVEQQWATGLDAPKGMALHDGTLYVSDIDRLVAISTEDGKEVESWSASGAKFLNDVTVDSEGRVFVSDMLDATIYVMDGGEISPWLEGGEITAPNGLLAEDDRLVVASWGVLAGEGFETETPGHVKVVDYDSKEVQSLGAGEPIGNLDGIEQDGQGGYLVTDWVNGGLFRITAEGEAEQLLRLDPGSADLEYIEEQSLAVIPMMMDDKVMAYRIE